MKSNSIKTADTYKWMLAAHSRTEKHGGFKTEHMKDLRSYTGIQVAARRLGYIIYYRSQFQWIEQKPTMVMAELLAHEYHIYRESRAKRVLEDKKKVAEPLVSTRSKTPDHPDIAMASFDPVIINKRYRRVPEKVSFWGLPSWMKRKPKVDTVLHETCSDILKECLAISDVLEQIWKDIDSLPTSEKLDTVTDKISELLEPEGAFDDPIKSPERL